MPKTNREFVKWTSEVSSASQDINRLAGQLRAGRLVEEKLRDAYDRLVVLMRDMPKRDE